MNASTRNCGGQLRRTFVIVLWVLFGMAAASPALAQGDHGPKGCPPDFGVEFRDCIESIGVGLVPTAQARALVPSEFILVGDGTPVTPIVVRTARCGRISVDGGRPRPGTIVQIGAVIAAPDFSGDINNYTLWYYTDNQELAHRLQRIGVPAQFVPTLVYDYNPRRNPSPLHVTIARPGDPPLRLDGFVTASDVPAGSFVANWWVKSGRRTVKMATGVPEIFIGTADLVLATRKLTDLGQLIGGDSLDFVILQQFNTFAVARMLVSKE